MLMKFVTTGMLFHHLDKGTDLSLFSHMGWGGIAFLDHEKVKPELKKVHNARPFFSSASGFGRNR
jgi:hypothetical protein